MQITPEREAPTTYEPLAGRMRINVYHERTPPVFSYAICTRKNCAVFS
jgi:hypothetical protein